MKTIFPLKSIYICGSWRHKSEIERLTAALRERDHQVLSFIENNRALGFGEAMAEQQPAWTETPEAQACFEFDTKATRTVDLVIYLGPSGCDAWAEVGHAAGSGVPVLGLWHPGERVGLMRKLVGRWVESLEDLLEAVVDPMGQTGQGVAQVDGHSLPQG